MHITLLGTGCPTVSTERYGPAQLIVHDTTRILVDCGSGVTQRLIGAGSAGVAVDALFLTHLHTDHVIDLYQLIMSSWHQGRARPWEIYGPPGTRVYVEGLMDLWEVERAQRIAHEMRPSTAGFEVNVTELSDGDRIEVGALSVRAFAVDHRPVRHAFGFHLEPADGGPVIVLSGDTRPCDALRHAARDADMLVNEVFVHRDLPVIEGVRTMGSIENVASYHTLSSEVGKLAAEAGVKILVLTHFVPPQADRAALLAEVAADFSGPVILGEDLMTIDPDRRRVIHGNVHMALARQ